MPSEFSYDDVMCEGQVVNSLDECPHNDNDDCGAFEGAGVYCYNGNPIGNVTVDKFGF